MNSSLAIAAEGIGHRYKRNWAVRFLDLKVPEGKVYGFLGLNGAGKSTTIRMLMGLLRRHEGGATVLGMDPERDPVGVKSAVGYVAEMHNFYEWMTLTEVIAFVSHYRPKWDSVLAGRLMERFDLAGRADARLSELSKGQRAKTALLLALAFRPRMLILDEPTGGLDPTARREFFEGVLTGYQEDGGTIFVSSHLVNEISGIVDYVGLIRNGEMMLETPVEELRSSVKRLRLTFEQGAPTPDAIACPGLLRARVDGREALVSVRDFDRNEEVVRKMLQVYGPASVEVEDLNLEDIFVEIMAKKEGKT